MSLKAIGASALIRILAAGAAVTGMAAVSAPAAANTASVDQAKVVELAGKIRQAVATAQLSADCQNKVADPKIELACQMGIEAQIEQVIEASGANSADVLAAMLQSQTDVVAAGMMTTPTVNAYVDLLRIVRQQAELDKRLTGAGVPAGPGVTNSISSPPVSSGGGGYITH